MNGCSSNTQSLGAAVCLVASVDQHCDAAFTTLICAGHRVVGGESGLARCAIKVHNCATAGSLLGCLASMSFSNRPASADCWHSSHTFFPKPRDKRQVLVAMIMGTGCVHSFCAPPPPRHHALVGRSASTRFMFARSCNAQWKHPGAVLIGLGEMLKL